MQEDNEAVALFLGYIHAQLSSGANFDQAQGLLALVLRVHGDRISAVPVLRALAVRLHSTLAEAWISVDEDVHAVKCMVSMFGKLQF